MGSIASCSQDTSACTTGADTSARKKSPWVGIFPNRPTAPWRRLATAGTPVADGRRRRDARPEAPQEARRQPGAAHAEEGRVAAGGAEVDGDAGADGRQAPADGEV